MSDHGPSSLHDIILRNLKRNRTLVQESEGPQRVVIICGTAIDRAYWQKSLEADRSELFRRDCSTGITSVSELTPRGNFLGTLQAWRNDSPDGPHTPNRDARVELMTMLFGQGTRLSPFTQSLGNSKPRFPTPYRSTALGKYLAIGELAALYSNQLLDHLQRGGFNGLVVKWGDEIIIPGTSWPDDVDYRKIDAVRFVWRTEPTPELARQKEWVLFDRSTRRMLTQLPRQEMDSLRKQVAARHPGEGALYGVNLGSLAVSSAFMAAAVEVFGTEIDDPGAAVDWDPYVWIALACADEQAWARELEYARSTGNAAMDAFQQKYPWFFPRIRQLKESLARITGHPLAIHVLDFGEPLWLDLGQHLALRQNLMELVNHTERAALLRDLFALPQKRDDRGNTIIDSVVPSNADVQDSLIMDATISDAASVIHRGVIIGSKHRRVAMPYGGISLFSHVDDLRFAGPDAASFQSIAPSLVLGEGGRHTTLTTPERVYSLETNESVGSYSGANFDDPILDNPLSFAQAATLMAALDPERLQDLRRDAIQRISPSN